jgi:hypothetical protein
LIHSETGLIHNFDPPKVAGFDKNALVKHDPEEQEIELEMKQAADALKEIKIDPETRKIMDLL